MKKIIFTVSALALCLALNAQSSISTEKWPNGNVKSSGTIIGETQLNSADSKEELARKSSQLTKDGKWIYNFENGKIRSEEYYNKGVMTGNWKSWYSDGTLESTIDFKSGNAVYYHANGIKHSEGKMAPGMVSVGKWTGYFDNGMKNYEGTYNVQGQKEGSWFWYNEKGAVVTEQFYNKGELISTK